MSVGQSPLVVVTVEATVGVGAQQLMALVGAVAGVQAGVADITVLAMVILMLLVTMHHQWCTQLRR